MLRWLIGIILGEIICESSNWQHIQILKITIPGANWQLFRLERIAKRSYFILFTQKIKFYWFVMKIKKFLLPIWWYNRGLFPLGNKYFGVFVLNGLTHSRILYLTKQKRNPYLPHFWLIDLRIDDVCQGGFTAVEQLGHEAISNELFHGEHTSSFFENAWIKGQLVKLSKFIHKVCSR